MDMNHISILSLVGDMVPKLVCDLASMLKPIEAGRQLLLDLLTLLDNIAQLLVGVLQLAAKGLDLSLTLHDTFGDHVPNYGHLIAFLLCLCLSILDSTESQAQLPVQLVNIGVDLLVWPNKALLHLYGSEVSLSQL
ncbi:hypothetical protein BHM03_00038624 [Ensete ventricosum]|nr:hypothetical protein BHM03_00038624 [Ensete ventricosum]